MLGEDAIIDGIAGNTVFSALSRCAAAPLKKLARMSRVASAAEGHEKIPSAITTAISDFETWMGSYQGEYTEEVAALIDDIKGSGAIIQLAEYAVIGRDSEALRGLIYSIFKRNVYSSEIDFNEFYKNICSCLRSSINEQVGEKALPTIISAYYRAIDEKFFELENAIRLLSADAQPNSKEIIAYAVTTLSPALAAALSHVNVQTVRGPKRQSLAKIYEKPTLVRITNPDALRVGRARNLSFDFETLNSDEVDYETLRDSFRRAVILGDPGGGKSTIGQSICLELANGNGKLIPLRTVIRHYNAALDRGSTSCLFDYICSNVSAISAEPLDDCKKAIRAIISEGRALLFFDGLDEIIEIGRRRDFVDEIVNFCDRFPLCPVIVTSRLVGYEKAPLPETFLQFGLAAFNDQQVRSYVAKHAQFIANHPKSAPDAEKLANDFLQKTEQHASDLRDNALMLSLMCGLYEEYNGEIPKKRSKIYEECSRLLFSRWDQERSIKYGLPEEDDLLNLLTAIAYNIYTDTTLFGGITKTHLTDIVQSFFVSIYADRARAHDETIAVVKHIVERTWIMVESGVATFEFTHRTFLEYFFARGLRDQLPDAGALVHELMPRIRAREAIEPIHLAIQLAISEGSSQTDRVATTLLSEIDRVSGEERANLLLFASETLPYSPFKEVHCSLLLDSIIPHILEDEASDKSGPSLELDHLLNACPERRGYVVQKIGDWVRDALLSANASARALMADAFSQNHYALRKFGEICYSVYLADRATFDQIATEDAGFASCLVDIIGFDYFKYIKIHGHDLWKVSAERDHRRYPCLNLFYRSAERISSRAVADDEFEITKEYILSSGLKIDIPGKFYPIMESAFIDDLHMRSLYFNDEQWIIAQFLTCAQSEVVLHCQFTDERISLMEIPELLVTELNEYSHPDKRMENVAQAIIKWLNGGPSFLKLGQKKKKMVRRIFFDEK